MTAPRHYTRGPDRRRATERKKVDAMSAALDFARSALEEVRLGKKLGRYDVESVIRIIDRAQGREDATARVSVRQARAHAAEQLRRIVLDAWKQRASRESSIEMVLDRLIFVVRDGVQ